MDFSLLKTLDENRINKKQKFIEYMVSLNNEHYTFLIEDSETESFEELFNRSDLKSIDEFKTLFQKIIIET